MPEGSIRDMEKPLDEKEFQRKLKKDQKALEKEEKKLKAKQKEAARLQAQLASDGAKKSEKKQKKEGATDENPEDFIGPDTPTGQKKLLASQMAKQYSPSSVEKSRAGFLTNGILGGNHHNTS